MAIIDAIKKELNEQIMEKPIALFVSAISE